MTRIKVCGITNVEDALAAVRHGAWALGFVFYKKSPRYVSPYKVRKIIDALPPFVTPVGVFVNTKEGAVKDILDFTKIRTVQLHGDEPPEYCSRFKHFSVIKVFRPADGFDIQTLKNYPAGAFLFDAHVSESYGGTGQVCDWDIVKAAKDFNRPVILSGGLNVHNVEEAISKVKPFAIDVSSGVESAPGKKDERLLVEFLLKAGLASR